MLTPQQLQSLEYGMKFLLHDDLENNNYLVLVFPAPGEPGTLSVVANGQREYIAAIIRKLADKWEEQGFQEQ